MTLQHVFECFYLLKLTQFTIFLSHFMDEKTLTVFILCPGCQGMDFWIDMGWTGSINMYVRYLNWEYIFIIIPLYSINYKNRNIFWNGAPYHVLNGKIQIFSRCRIRTHSNVSDRVKKRSIIDIGLGSKYDLLSDFFSFKNSISTPFQQGQRKQFHCTYGKKIYHFVCIRYRTFRNGSKKPSKFK